MAQISPTDPVFSAAVLAVLQRSLIAGANVTLGTNFPVTINSSGGTGGTSTGSVTSVGLADASTNPIYGITSTPITTSGTLSMALSTSTTPNLVFATNTSGATSVQPSFRALGAGDLPNTPGIGG